MSNALPIERIVSTVAAWRARATSSTVRCGECGAEVARSESYRAVGTTDLQCSQECAYAATARYAW